MLRMSPDLAELLDAALGDGAAADVTERLGDLGDGEAAHLVLRGCCALLFVRWYAFGRVSTGWWHVARDARGKLVPNVIDPGGVTKGA